MTTLTIFFCGTGSTKFETTNANYWDDELVSTLASHHSGREFAEWIGYNYGERSVTQQKLQEQIIKTFRKGSVIPTQVNLVGWSRGGIYAPDSGLTTSVLDLAAYRHIR